MNLFEFDTRDERKNWELRVDYRGIRYLRNYDLRKMPKFTPRQRKHKINKREKHTAVVPQDTNVVELQPASKTEKEERRQELREELRAQQPKISSKKQKRLDKYIVRSMDPQ